MSFLQTPARHFLSTTCSTYSSQKLSRVESLDDGGEVAEFLKVFHGASAFRDLGEDFEHTLVTDTAGRALTAALFAGELQVELGDGHHAGGVVHDHHTARAHHGAGSGKAFIVDSSVEVFLRQAAA